GCGLRPRDEPLAFTGWAWMTGCTWIGLVSFGWLIGGGSVWSLGPATWTALSLLPAAVCAVPLARRGARGRAANAMSAASESAGSVSATLVSAASAPVSAAERTTACAATRRDASPRWERVLFAACLAFALVSVADRIVLAGTRVVASGDEGSIWTAKARALWTAGGLDARFAELAHREFGIWHQDYPPLDPLLQVYAAQLAGRPLDFENRLPVLLFLPALLLLLAGALRRCARPALAGLLLVAFATCTMTVDVAQQAYADALVAVGMLALLESVRRWRREGTTAWLALASVAATALVFSKNESRMLLLAAALGGAAAWWAHRRAAGTREQVEGSVRVDLRVERRPHGAAPVRLRAADAVWLLPPLAVLVAITAVNARFGFANDLLASSDGRGPLERLAGQGAGRVAEVLRLCAGALLAACRDSSLLVAGCALLVLLFPRHLLAPRAPGEVRPDRSAWSLTLLLAACGYLLVFLGTPLDVAWHVRWSVPRLCFQLLPVAAVCLAAGLTWLLRRAGSAGAQV
ncbi:MAG TPA: glycosyltransferase family 39 protein, partial [Planctomycetota bacterium]|nr:glycosyltransferase family 39 protein [Planctomycetota bacterium]